MSSSSSSSSNPHSGLKVPKKLGKSNYPLWKAFVRSAIRGARLQGHLSGDAKAPNKEIITTEEGKEKEGKKRSPNPAFEEWEVRDQQVLNFLLSSISKDVATQVATRETAGDVWAAIEEMFASQTRARTVHLRIALANTKKGNSNITDYFNKMKALGDEMIAAGRNLDDEELVEYILTGLGEDYTSLVTALTARVEKILVGELYSQLLNFENRMDLTYGGSAGSANAVNRGRGGFSRGGGRTQGSQGGQQGRGRGGSSSRGRGNSNFPRGGGRGSYNRSRTSPSEEDDRPLCQVCFKLGHTADRCWHRYDEDYVPDPKHVAAATKSYSVDTNWYADTVATDHITSDLDKLAFRNKYHGGDQIHTANSTGMNISHVGHATFHTPYRDIHLNNVLHVPQSQKI
ncbi:uncharacterized protein LOC110436245 [Sorghum bicolor]|uniref:uncharacterized protein LOC110436245 n=1 Tax=Sorghum bicolor TaxID=4558 RepID=UPI000B4250B6|nr:uncharacterized protein LOC110436245 [Sorghum bicolor]XP_021318433.1 uncharacterized protein LOC110436245 [Sorghum bicolor]XP_021318434.1 uncharacterized protein LOC110436245 [Sorghum bicolor]|eukprot:XP_021318431.1 uncharacterized protein LOC110436245 [Sorghum bicolor]